MAMKKQCLSCNRVVNAEETVCLNLEAPQGSFERGCGGTVFGDAFDDGVSSSSGAGGGGGATSNADPDRAPAAASSGFSAAIALGGGGPSAGGASVGDAGGAGGASWGGANGPSMGGGGGGSGAAREQIERGRVFIKRIEKLREARGGARPRIIVMFGFSATGKTFFTLRTKHAGTGLKYLNCEPPLQTPDSSEDWDRGERIGGTKGIELHTLAKRNDVVAIVDIEGEAFNVALKRGFGGGADESDDLLLQAIALADGFIFMAPAAETLMPTAWDTWRHKQNPAYDRGESERRIQALYSNMQGLVQFVRFVAHQRVSTRAKITSAREGQIAKAIQDFKELRARDASGLNRLIQYDRTDKPALFLLSKADAYLGLCMEMTGEARGGAQSRGFDVDPVDAMVRSDNASTRLIVKALYESFKSFRIDFVTMADGHREHQADVDEADRRRFDYGRPHYGIKDNFEWLKRRIDRARNPIVGRLDLGIAPAIMLRRRLRPSFNEVLS
jgi:hypothetical protein